MRIAIAALVLLILCAGESAQDFSGYKCNIKQSLQLGKDGSAQQYELAESYRNMEFIIDRASGRMLGGTVSEVWSHQVWDRGSDQQSYKAIYGSIPLIHLGRIVGAGPPYINLQMLQIGEYEQGAVKPFLLVDGMTMHMGTCTHLR
jgi:hypothetical protein